jgi:cbb3-type cytochrome oxidase maturation protein
VNALFFLIPVSVVLVVLAMVIFWWAVRSHQFEDLEANAHRALMEEEQLHKPASRGRDDPSHH